MLLRGLRTRLTRHGTSPAPAVAIVGSRRSRGRRHPWHSRLRIPPVPEPRWVRTVAGGRAEYASRVRAVQITRFGGPEVLKLRELPDPVPAPGQLLVEVTRAGVNYADTHQTDNSYLAPASLPLVPGVEV